MPCVATVGRRKAGEGPRRSRRSKRRRRRRWGDADVALAAGELGLTAFGSSGLVHGAPHTAVEMSGSAPVALATSRSALAGPAISAPARAAVRHDLRVGPGVALTPEQRRFFEPRLAHDLGAIRLHAGAEAGALAKLAGTRAFALGRDVFFAPGQLAPRTRAGRKLLAHELAHTVQQGAATPRVEPSVAARGRAPHPRPFMRASAVPRLSRRAAVIQRAAPVIGGLTLGAAAAKCIIGAIVGALFDIGIQAGIAKFKGQPIKIDYCSVVLSAILGCIAAPVSAAFLEPFIAAKLGPALGGIAGTLIGKILIFIAQKLGMAIPKSIVGKLLKLGCISEPQAAVLGVQPEHR